MGKAKVTISDVARAAGVSSSAVSYALNDKPGVSSETREKVLRVAETMGWKPNSAAKALSDANTRSIGLVLSMNPEVFAVESYAMALIAGLGAELEKRDYSLLLRIVPGHKQRFAHPSQLDCFRQRGRRLGHQCGNRRSSNRAV